ncbi:PREDICTED: protein IRX15-LIKE-like [Ipomoea nil]|uniref:protein IRX15-LIKE-like n=1 Tax=Ipomoea nil TaxID=35883 RepID=UPI000900A0DB|nr:PREDICTED: protein IRX15-LIKE-like [Ipomoea nil]
MALKGPTSHIYNLVIYLLKSQIPTVTELSDNPVSQLVLQLVSNSASTFPVKKMKAGITKLIVLHPPAVPASSPRVLLLGFISFFALASALTFFSAKDAVEGGGKPPAGIPQPVLEALVHYAAVANTTYLSSRMSSAEVGAVAAALRRCGNACNFLVFGLSHETLLWHSLNHGGRTVFVDESAYMVAKAEEKHRGIEAYDIQFTTKAAQLYHLLEHAKERGMKECRPVQNLLFSDCKLAVNDLPNHIYDVAWDVILVDGPRGYAPSSPGRMSAIFTAGVLARSKVGGEAETQVFVHEIGREVERVSSERFLCNANLVDLVDALGHFAVTKMDAANFRFCSPLMADE